MKQILIRPLVTEKMSAITDKQGKYGFIVNRDANKIEIKHAVEKSRSNRCESKHHQRRR